MQWSDWSHRFSIPLQLLIVFLFCTLVGLFLSAINIGSHRSDLLINLAISCLIGFSIWAIERVLRLWRWIESTQLRALVAIVAGAVAGGGTGGWIFLDHLGKLESFRGELLRILLLGLVFGALSLYIIYTQTTLHRRREQLAAEREQRVEQERQLTQSRLDHLQAQIEPHFLFNTLANIHSRIESAPDEARMMMEHLTQILRGRLDSSGHEIPLGGVATYGELAAQLGSSPRAVGGACRNNPIPLLIPCHRVVSKTGVGGFSGEWGEGERVETKRWLLRHEGVTRLS